MFFVNLRIFFFSIRHTPMRAREHPFAGRVFCRRRSLLCVHPTRSAPSLHHLGAAHQTSLRSWRTMMSYPNSLA